VLDGDARNRLVSNIVGQLCQGVSDEVLARAFHSWKNVGQERFEQAVGGASPKRLSQ
jgi:catalase